MKSINVSKTMPPVVVFKLCYFNKNQSCEDDIIDECAKNAFNEIGKVNLRNIWPEFIRVQQDVNLYRLYYYIGITTVYVGAHI